MTEITATAEAVRPARGIAALLRHSHYVLSENPVTAFAFGLFLLIMAVMYVLLNLVIDILYGVIDPRVRLEG